MELRGNPMSCCRAGRRGARRATADENAPDGTDVPDVRPWVGSRSDHARQHAKCTARADGARARPSLRRATSRCRAVLREVGREKHRTRRARFAQRPTPLVAKASVKPDSSSKGAYAAQAITRSLAARPAVVLSTVCGRRCAACAIQLPARTAHPLSTRHEARPGIRTRAARPAATECTARGSTRRSVAAAGSRSNEPSRSPPTTRVLRRAAVTLLDSRIARALRGVVFISGGYRAARLDETALARRISAARSPSRHDIALRRPDQRDQEREPRDKRVQVRGPFPPPLDEAQSADRERPAAPTPLDRRTARWSIVRARMIAFAAPAFVRSDETRVGRNRSSRSALPARDARRPRRGARLGQPLGNCSWRRRAVPTQSRRGS